MLEERVEQFIRAHDLIPPRGEVTCLVSGGADSTCLWHVLRDLGYRVSAVHVNHKLRGGESEEDARFCRERFGAEVVERPGGRSEEELRKLRYTVEADRLRATGHTASDQVETLLYNIVARGKVRGIDPKSDVVHPLLEVWRPETEAYCRERGLAFRTDSSNPATTRGVIRAQVLPVLRRLHPDADANILRLLELETMPGPIAELLRAPLGSKRVDLGGGVQAVREYDRLWLERGPVDLVGTVDWGAWRISSDIPGLKVRGWKPGDRLAGRSKKIQDVFVDAKIPRSEREAWPLVVRGEDVLAVPGIVEHPGVSCVRRLDGARDLEAPAWPAPED
jgi:tRNA(Ile)-lysidine synthase